MKTKRQPKTAKPMTTLTKQLAEKYLAGSRKVDIESFTAIDVDAVEALARDDYAQLSLNSLPSLSAAAAEVLAKKKSGSISLNGLKELSDAVAKALAKYQGCLHLDGLTGLSDGVAESLGRKSGMIILRGLTQLSAGQATALVKRENGLDLSGLQELPDEVAEALSRHNVGWLNLDGVKGLSGAAALALARRGGWLSLRGLEKLGGDAAEALAGHAGLLNLSSAVWGDVQAARRRFAKSRKGMLQKAKLGCPQRVFEWMRGGVMAVKAKADDVLEKVRTGGGKELEFLYQIDAGGWCLAHLGVFHDIPDGFNSLNQYLSVELQAMVVHLWYDDITGIVGYTIHRGGQEVECYNQAELFEGVDEPIDGSDGGKVLAWKSGNMGVSFKSSLVQIKKEDLALGEVAGIDVQFINKRFKQLGLGLPAKL